MLKILRASEHMKVRRTMALVSFGFIIFTIIFCMIVSFTEKSVADNFNSFIGIITPIIACLTGIIMQYQHQCQQQDREGMKNVKPPDKE